MAGFELNLRSGRFSMADDDDPSLLQGVRQAVDIHRRYQ
jgi:hypothetical protein